jgi:hypothetical protein
MDELKGRFPSCGVLDTLGVVYPQYWLQVGAEVSFQKHLNVLKAYYGESKWIMEGDENKQLVPAVLDCFQLEVQQPLFKLAILSNAQAAMESLDTLNPLTRLWQMLDANTALAKSFSEYVKLAQIAMIHVLGSVDDERCFSSLNFLKDKLRNRLDESHLLVVVGMHGQNVFSLKDFPYEKCFQ